MDGRGYQLLEVETPCVVTVLSSANRPRYMSVRGIVEAYDKQVEVWGFDNISVEESKLGLAGSPTRVSNPSRRVRNPQVRSSSWSRPKQPI